MAQDWSWAINLFNEDDIKELAVIKIDKLSGECLVNIDNI